MIQNGDSIKFENGELGTVILAGTDKSRVQTPVIGGGGDSWNLDWFDNDRLEKLKQAKSITIYVCQKCGDKESSLDRLTHWKVETVEPYQVGRVTGEMTILCENCK